MTASNSIIILTNPRKDIPANPEGCDSNSSLGQAAAMLNELVYALLLRENVSAADLNAEDAADILASQFLVTAAEAQQ